MDADEAEALVRLTRATGRIFAVTLNNTGYPMVRQMREMVAAGDLGPLRGIHAEYVQDWLAHPIDAGGQKQAAWRTDPARAGASAVLADIGVHAFSLASYASGLTLERVAADLSTAVPGRRLDDNANLLLRWQGGVPGTLIASQTAPGHFNDLSLRLYGEKAGLHWAGTDPDTLRFTPLGEPTRLIRRGGPGCTPEAQATARLPASHPEGFIEAFANLYRDAVALIVARRDGIATDRAPWVPDVLDGARGVKFVGAAVASHANGGAWTPAALEL
jgi:predicted dehydrogenase